MTLFFLGECDLSPEIASTPLVSVIIPTYNHAHLLERALQSVLDQTYSCWEVIVVDNHSSDHTDEIVENFFDSRMRCLKINNNGVIAASRNLGISAAKGAWLAFLDSDDWWRADKLDICIQNIREGVDLIYHPLQCFKVDDVGEVVFLGRLEAKKVINDPVDGLMKQGPSLTTSGIFVKKEKVDLVRGFDENQQVVAGEDYDLWLRLAKAGCNFCYIDRVLGYYMVGGIHMTSAQRSLRLVDYLQKKHFHSGFKGAPDWIHKSRIASFIRIGKYSVALAYFGKLLMKLNIIRSLRVIMLLVRPAVYKFIFGVRTL